MASIAELNIKEARGGRFCELKQANSGVFPQPLTRQVEVQCILGAVEDHSLHACHLSQQVIHHLKDIHTQRPEEGVLIDLLLFYSF